MRVLVSAAVVVIVALVGAFVLLMWTRATTEPVSLSHAGVCVDLPSNYSMEASEGTIIAYDNDGARMQIVVGADAILSDAELVAANNAGGAVVPSANGREEFVAARSGLPLRIELFGVDDGARDRLLAGVRFCGNDRQ